MRVSVELVPDEGGRLEGRILTEDGRPDLTFSGTLDLLRALEELQHSDRDRGDAVASAATLTGSQPRKDSSCG